MSGKLGMYKYLWPGSVYSDIILVIEYNDSNLLLFNTCTTIPNYHYLTRVQLTIGKESCLDLQGIRINEMRRVFIKNKLIQISRIILNPGIEVPIPVENVPGSRDCKP